jgi:hypothetical protein
MAKKVNNVDKCAQNLIPVKITKHQNDCSWFIDYNDQPIVAKKHGLKILELRLNFKFSFFIKIQWDSRFPLRFSITQALCTIETLHNTQALHTTFCSHYAPQKLHIVSRFAPTKKHMHIFKLCTPPSFVTTPLKHYAFLKFLTFALMIQHGVTPHSMEEAMPWILK